MEFIPKNATLYHKIDQAVTEFYVHHVHLDQIETSIHQHKKAQLLYAEGGIVHIFTENKHWYLPARCFMWIPPETEHYILSFSNNVDLYNFYFSVNADEDRFYQTNNIYFANDLLREMILHTQSWDGPISKVTISQYYFLKAIKAILPELTTNKLPFPIQHPFPSDEKLLAITRFLNKNLEKNYSLEEVAKEFGLSTRTLSRKFKENLGMNYVRFLRALRITKSLELIAENKYNMYEVAMLVGYNSLSSFSNVFYKELNMRPTEYAQYLKNKPIG